MYPIGIARAPQHGRSVLQIPKPPMIDHRPLYALPAANLGWLSRHHFPVDGRLDPAHMPVKSLYVWNDDEFAAGHGFPLHHHQDVEIITYVRSGVVTHQDTLGNSSVASPRRPRDASLDTSARTTSSCSPAAYRKTSSLRLCRCALMHDFSQGVSGPGGS